jgi:hypothetical protein
MNSTRTHLIDIEGRVVRTWMSNYPALCAYLLDNGHLLRAGTQRMGSFGGPGSAGRIQEFTWEGEVLWDYLLSTERNHPHHDICPMPNGNVLVIAWDKKNTEEAIAAGRHPKTVRGEFLPDCILEVRKTGKTTGEIVWQWHAWDHLIQELDKTKANYGEVSEHPELIDINFGTGIMAAMLNDPKELAKLKSLGYVGGGAGGPGPGPGGPPGGPDWMHTNSVAYHPELDQIMLSVHEFSEVWIIDHSTTTAEASSHRGGRSGKGGDLLYRWGNPRAYRNGTNVDQRLFAQHCAKWIPKGLPGEGHMLVFNNGGGRPDGMYSSVDEVVLPVDKNGRYAREEFQAFGPDKAVWSYSDKGNFHSGNISGAQRLPNGNTFVCSGAAGVLFEVTPGKEVVWKYSMPQQGPGGPFGPFGPFKPGELRPGRIFPSFLQDMLQMTDDQKAKLDALQKQVDSEVAKILTKDQQAKLDEMHRAFTGGPGFGPPGFGPPGFGPPGFGPPGFGPPAFAPPDGKPGDAAQGGPSAKRTPGQGGPGAPGGSNQGGPNQGGPGGLFGPGPGGPGGGHLGLFTCYRYGPDLPGLAGKDLTPGKKLEDLIAEQDASKKPPPKPGKPNP